MILCPKCQSNDIVEINDYDRSVIFECHDCATVFAMAKEAVDWGICEQCGCEAPRGQVYDPLEDKVERLCPRCIG